MSLNGYIDLYDLSILWKAAEEICTSKSTLCFWFGEVGHMGVYIEDHVRCNVSNCGIFYGCGGSPVACGHIVWFVQLPVLVVQRQYY